MSVVVVSTDNLKDIEQRIMDAVPLCEFPTYDYSICSRFRTKTSDAPTILKRRYGMKKGFLSGYKTYIIGALTILTALAAYAVGEPVAGVEVLNLPQLAQLVITAVLGMTIRHGVAHS